jgi:hypothetical protein
MSQTHNTKVPPQICILSGVHDDVYRSTRSDDPVLCTSAGKRKLLYQAIAEASGASPLILSPHPRGRGVPSALPETTSQFAGCRQIFARACGIRKVRYFIDFIHYARHVFEHTNENSILIIDNYELIYVLAIYYARFRGRRNPVILEYEDGKHAIDKGYVKVISWFAEWLAKPLVKAALLATPTLAKRLPPETPIVLVPGILEKQVQLNPLPDRSSPTHFLYSGSLDVERGIPLLLDYLESCTLPSNAVFEITGQGHFRERFVRLMDCYPKQVIYHGTVSNQVLSEIRSRCHFGLNLQSSTNPISEVTYPSKTFDYLNAGLRVISTQAAGVSAVLGEAAHYLDDETSAALALAVESAAGRNEAAETNGLAALQIDYSFEGTIRRLSGIIGPVFNPLKQA